MVAARQFVAHGGPGLAASPPAGYDAGGQIAELQAQIERRLRFEAISATRNAQVNRVERAVRIMSVGSGYVALGLGYLLAVGGYLYLT